MANRFWVGGSGTWDNTSTAHWSATSGGAAGASAPTSSDNVFFDANSGTGTVTAAFGNACLDLDMSATSILTVSGGSLEVYGSATLKSGMTWNFSINFNATTTGKTFTSAGNAFNGADFNFQGVGGGWTLQDNLTIGGTHNINVSAGTLNTNGKTITCTGNTGIVVTGTATLTLGASVITSTGSIDLSSGSTTATYNFNSAVLTCTSFFGPKAAATFNAGTSTINVTDGNGSFWGASTNGASMTYYNLNLTGAVNIGPGNAIDFHDSNTFNALTISPGVTVLFTNGTTQTVNSFSAIGTNGNLITITSDTTATHALVKATPGSVSCDFLNIQHSVATPAGIWNAGVHSVNNQGVSSAGSGWIFDSYAVVASVPDYSFRFKDQVTAY